jgi:hypothetical protein
MTPRGPISSSACSAHAPPSRWASRARWPGRDPAAPRRMGGAVVTARRTRPARTCSGVARGSGSFASVRRGWNHQGRGGSGSRPTHGRRASDCFRRRQLPTQRAGPPPHLRAPRRLAPAYEIPRARERVKRLPTRDPQMPVPRPRSGSTRSPRPRSRPPLAAKRNHQRCRRRARTGSARRAGQASLGAAGPRCRSSDFPSPQLRFADPQYPLGLQTFLVIRRPMTSPVGAIIRLNWFQFVSISKG